jgi:hypothetical protein
MTQPRRDTTRFDVLCVKKFHLDEEHSLSHLTFDRVCKDIVVPYVKRDTFHVGGAPIKERDVHRIQIVLVDWPNRLVRIDKRPPIKRPRTSEEFASLGTDVTNAMIEICKRHCVKRRFWKKQSDPYAEAFTAFETEFPEIPDPPPMVLDKKQYRGEQHLDNE